MTSPATDIVATKMAVRLNFTTTDELNVLLVVDGVFTPLACFMPIGTNTCQVTGSVPIPANTPLNIAVDTQVSTPDPEDAVMVTWQATSP